MILETTKESGSLWATGPGDLRIMTQTSDDRTIAVCHVPHLRLRGGKWENPRFDVESGGG
jgi:hypothetical protein